MEIKNIIIEKARRLKLAEIIEIEPHSIIIKTVVKKATGNITLVSIDQGAALVDEIIPFDSFAIIIEGKAEIIIDGESQLVESGDAIIFPAHKPKIIKAKEPLKLILTIIKSGYE